MACLPPDLSRLTPEINRKIKYHPSTVVPGNTSSVQLYQETQPQYSLYEESVVSHSVSQCSSDAAYVVPEIA
eukprot:3110333-Rhodomonas_salina.3